MSVFSFIAIAIASLGWLPITAALAAPVADPNAYVTANVNLRAGPDTDYPAVIVIPASEYVTIYACIEDLTWCDVSYGENRGWVSAQYIQPYYQDRYMTVQEYAPLVSLPTGPYDIKVYWNSFYSGQPFYGELDQWAAPRPAFRTNSFYEPLGSYGDWVEVEDQYVWVPRGVDHDWRPYTRGHWTNTEEYGWFWASDEPFGWATYHYGRWGFRHDVGWFWVPGTRWAPAWVAWRGSDNYLGWAPLPPAPDDGLSVSISIGTVPDYYWQVVPAQSFLSVNLSLAIVHGDSGFRSAFGETRPLGNVTIVNNVVVNKVVNVTYVEQKTQRKVVVEKVAAAGTADPAGKNALGKVAVFTPEAKGVEKPTKLKKVEEVALVSKTKGQAGDQKELDLATLHKLKGPPPGKKAKAVDGGGPPPPPPAPTGVGKAQNAAKVVEQPCTNGLARKAPGGRCECLPPKKEVNGACEIPPALEAKEAPCTNGLARKAPGGQCECLPPKKEVNGTCEIPPAAAAKEAPCTNGLARRAPGGQCECLPPKREVNGVCEIPPAKEAKPQPPNCQPGEHAVGQTCAPNGPPKCGPGEHAVGQTCAPNGPPKGAGPGPTPGPGPGEPKPQCKPGQKLGPDNKCHKA